ncbi:MAG: NAD(P)/FAD-dependent oxidoreductase [Halieaceae bacterium]|jgi:acetone monooxygenase|nr:NAD(P)/FAD-dependent oxidoreductase [Halieaceae bacterium]
MTESSEHIEEYDAVVVGAGFTGLYQLYKFREQGLKVCVFEAGTGVGGTWYWNRYPGARTDSEARVYQYWFSDELLDEWDWSERFPAQQETERYLNFVADKFDLRKDISFNSRVKTAHYDEASKRWIISTEGGRRVSCQFFVMGAGGLSVPHLPDIQGIEDFRGTLVHTSRWPQEGIDLEGKRVGIIGTGATGIQVIQTIAEQVGSLTVFQRTPNFTIPMKNPKLDEAALKAMRADYPRSRHLVHTTFGGHFWGAAEQPFMALGEAERKARMDELWEDGSLRFWAGSYADVFTDEKVSEIFSEYVARHVRARVDDPLLAEKLIPTDHGFGTRRVPLETNYYEAYNRDNVTLVDLHEDPIEHIDKTGIATRSGHHELDILICATGFDAGTGALTSVDIRGREGRVLKDYWDSNGVRTYLGLQVNGFPNMFMVMGPMSPAAAFCNVPTCLQQQVDWISDCVSFVRASDSQAIEPSAEAETSWGQHHDEIASEALVTRTDSWYTGANIEGKPRRLLAYIGGVPDYQAHCDAERDSGFSHCVLY